MKPLPVFASLLALCGCVTMPETYAPPVQRQPIEGSRPYRVSRVIGMGDPDAEAYIVSGIHKGKAEGGAWRWTEKRPTVRLQIKGADRQKLVADYTVPAVTFSQTGPVVLQFFVNDRLLETVRVAEPGQRRFEKEVPFDWLKPMAENVVAIEIDKLYVSGEDQSALGFILTRIGLTQ